jgi:hypothetical protein
MSREANWSSVHTDQGAVLDTDRCLVSVCSRILVRGAQLVSERRSKSKSKSRSIQHGVFLKMIDVAMHNLGRIGG